MMARDEIDARDASGDDVLFERVLLPHRSLPPVGFLAVMALLIGLSVAIGVGFTLVGAWPVIGFFGLDIILVYVVFQMSYRSARRSEHVRLTARELAVTADDGSGGIRRAVLQPYWAQVELVLGARNRQRLLLRSHGHVMELGSFLGPDEQSVLADALQDALRRLRTAAP